MRFCSTDGSPRTVRFARGRGRQRPCSGNASGGWDRRAPISWPIQARFASPIRLLAQGSMPFPLRSGQPNAARLRFGRLDDGPAHVVAAIRAHAMRRYRRAALRAIFQPPRLDGIVRVAAARTGIRTFSFGYGHSKLPAHLGSDSPTGRPKAKRRKLLQCGNGAS